MPLQSYRNLVVWQKSFDLAFNVYQLTRNFPREELFGMTSQLRRAGMSISNIIAEGHGRATQGQFIHALSIARGSTNEVENCLLMSQRLNYGSIATIDPLLGQIDEIQRMLEGLRTKQRQRSV